MVSWSSCLHLPRLPLTSIFQDKLATIDRLQDHHLFYEDIVDYLGGRADTQGQVGRTMMSDDSIFVAEAIATR